MAEPILTNLSTAGQSQEAAMGQPVGQLHQLVPGLREAVAFAFSVPLGPAILLALVMQQIQGQLAKASSRMDQFAKPAGQGLGEFAGSSHASGRNQPSPARPPGA